MAEKLVYYDIVGSDPADESEVLEEGSKDFWDPLIYKGGNRDDDEELVSRNSPAVGGSRVGSIVLMQRVHNRASDQVSRPDHR